MFVQACNILACVSRTVGVQAELKQSKAEVEQRLHSIEDEYKLVTQHLSTKKEEAAGATAEVRVGSRCSQ